MKSTKSFVNDPGFAYEYTGYSFVRLARWKYYTLRQTLAFERFQRKTRQRDSLEKLRRIAGGSHGPALIIANGASSLELPYTDLDRIRKELRVFGMNNFFDSPISSIIRPDYLMICDELYWSSEYQEYKNKVKAKQLVSNFTIVQPDYLPPYLGCEQDILRIRRNSLPSFSKNIRVDTCLSGLPRYTAHYAIATAIHMGHSPIFVTGMDLNHYKFININQSDVLLNSHHNYSSRQESSVWRKRETISKILSTTLSSMDSLELFAKHKVIFVGQSPTHDKLSFMSVKDFLGYFPSE
jgi:hypothetical protein